MLQKTTRPTSVFGLSKGEHSSSPHQGEQNIFIWPQLNPGVWLPNTFGAFSRFLIVIAVLGAGSAVNIYISSNILDAQVTQQALEVRYQEIQRVNSQLVWEISQHVAIEKIQQRSAALGFTERPQRTYAVATVSEEKLASLLDQRQQTANGTTDATDALLVDQETQPSMRQFPSAMTSLFNDSNQLVQSGEPRPEQQTMVVAQANAQPQRPNAMASYFWSALQAMFGRVAQSD